MGYNFANPPYQNRDKDIGVRINPGGQCVINHFWPCVWPGLDGHNKAEEDDNPDEPVSAALVIRRVVPATKSVLSALFHGLIANGPQGIFAESTEYCIMGVRG
ncbi:hypothetical protein JTE90_023211 [Oedothorax gibbosus]|uniref:Uncharacterized protein n=1 Tax=Oedothorax gibbosus TaxID=931172 RepID=A0AAV6VJG0_9ARAC|nr:hypothetical protein JTE90_023211 [Oedothorax gibbosus]